MISKERLQEIKKYAKENQNKSLNQIAKENNIKVILTDLSDIWDTPLSWAIWLFDENFHIYIEKDNHTHRQRFTYAHELGHFFLHKNILKEKHLITDKKEKYLFRGNIYEKIPEGEKWMEEEANEFAWNLLMPEEKIREAIWIFGVNIWLLSESFKVSPSAIEYRLYKLNIRNDF